MSEYLLSGIGRRIRSLRLERAIKLTGLAGRAGISKGLLSKIENGRTVPSLPVLLAIIQALDLQPETFFRDLRFTPPRRYIHRGAGQLTPIEKEAGATGFHYFHILDRGFEHFSLEAVVLEILPDAQRQMVTTDAYEFKYVLEGEVDYQIEDEHIALRTGDSLLYDGRLPHVPHNRGDRPARMLVIYLYSQDNSPSE